MIISNPHNYLYHLRVEFPDEVGADSRGGGGGEAEHRRGDRQRGRAAAGHRRGQVGRNGQRGQRSARLSLGFGMIQESRSYVAYISSPRFDCGWDL